jgi:exopolysaccharide biosynthesis polyprenyl glycosylphosphotransferase
MAFGLSPYSQIAYTSNRHVALLTAVVTVGLLTSLCAHVLGLHDTLARKDPWHLATRSIAATLAALVLFIIYVTVIKFEQVGRYIITEILLYLPPLMIGARWLFCHGWLKTERKLLVLGSDGDRQEIQAAASSAQLPISVVGNTADMQQALALARAQQVDEIIYGMVEAPSTQVMESLMECQQAGVQISDISLFIENNFFRIPHDRIGSQWFFLAGIEHLHSGYHVVKRLIDVGISLVALFLLSPVMAVIATLIKLESRGPAFYSQNRVGKNGKVFRIWKFRSMRADAEAAGPQWAQRGDRRVTRLGAILRKTRLDETPQFWNILDGSMSFIGPRPERPEYVRVFEAQIPLYRQRNLIKPGLTGWAQINYPYGAGLKDAAAKLQFDLFYIKKMSPSIDFQILLRTVGSIMKGAR